MHSQLKGTVLPWCSMCWPQQREHRARPRAVLRSGQRRQSASRFQPSSSLRPGAAFTGHLMGVRPGHLWWASRCRPLGTGTCCCARMYSRLCNAKSRSRLACAILWSISACSFAPRDIIVSFSSLCCSSRLYSARVRSFSRFSSMMILGRSALSCRCSSTCQSAFSFVLTYSSVMLWISCSLWDTFTVRLCSWKSRDAAVSSVLSSRCRSAFSASIPAFCSCRQAMVSFSSDFFSSFFNLISSRLMFALNAASWARIARASRCSCSRCCRGSSTPMFPLAGRG
mmetsp:Transcript_21261/g.61394  ORF Transcript_21261/g.61394 Transcript_21261/m.61394 type:complete len:283 (-) Transcript_21261:167-1015(-)